MTVIEAPGKLDNPGGFKKVFLGGGITGVKDWQTDLIELLDSEDKEDLALFNPRRKNFPIHIPEEAERQIRWEFFALRDADAIIMYFASGSIQPICLYELGKWITSDDRPACIGIDSKYERKNDVIIQTKLARPDVPIFIGNQEKVLNQIKDWVIERK